MLGHNERPSWTRSSISITGSRPTQNQPLADGEDRREKEVAAALAKVAGEIEKVLGQTKAAG